MGQGARGLVGGGCVLSHAAGKVSFGITKICEVVAVVKAAVLRVVEVGCVLLAQLSESHEARSLSAVAGDGVRLDNLFCCEVFGCFAIEILIPALLFCL